MNTRQHPGYGQKLIVAGWILAMVFALMLIPDRSSGIPPKPPCEPSGCIVASTNRSCSGGSVTLTNAIVAPTNFCLGTSASASVSQIISSGQEILTPVCTNSCGDPCSDGCPPPKTNMISAIVLSNVWTATVGSWTASGVGTNASFTPTNCGSGSVEFKSFWMGGCSAEMKDSSASASFKVLNVDIVETNKIICVCDTAGFTLTNSCGDVTWEVSPSGMPGGPTVTNGTVQAGTNCGVWIVTARSVENTNCADTTTLIVVGVESLSPDRGCEVDDGDSNAHTRKFVVCAVPFQSVNVCAVPCPAVVEANLPPCWVLLGGSGNSKLCRTLNTSPPGTNAINAVAGCSYKTATIVSEQADFELRLASFIPAPWGQAPFPYNSCSAGTNGVRNVLYQGDGRGFDPTSDSYRTLQLQTVVPSSMCDGAMLPKPNWHGVGVSRNYADNAIVAGQISAAAQADTILNDCDLKIGEMQGVEGTHWTLTESVTRLDAETVQIVFSGHAKDPLYIVACDIDWCLTLTIRKPCGGPIEWTLTGNHDKFPAFELYLNKKPLYQAMPAGSIFDLCDGDCGEITVNTGGTVEEP